MKIPAARPAAGITPGRAFLAVLGRDLYVTGKEFPVFLAQVVLQPLFMLFVFGRILTQIGVASHSFASVLFPGIVALTATLTALQSTALPLVIDFSFTKEIEDRLLAPLPVSFVAIEKLVFAALRALVAAAVMFPIGVIVLGSVPWRAGGAAMVIITLVLAAFAGSTIGLTLGTLVTPARINILFALILTPLLFTGCSQYPWESLHEHLLWFQVVTALNPLTYASEGMRGALVPEVPHMYAWVCVLILLVSIALFGAIGIRGFLRRAID